MISNQPVRLSTHKLRVATSNLQDIYDLGVKELHQAVFLKDWDKVHELSLKLAHTDNIMEACKIILKHTTTH